VFHRKAVREALIFATVAALLQPLSGDYSAKDIAERQPAKLAAMEALYQTSKPADLIIGGIPDEKNETVHYAIHLPGFLSFLAHGNFDAEVTGLDKIPKDERPPVLITHIAFQVMVVIGSFLALTGIVYIVLSIWWKKMLLKNWWLKWIAITTPLGFLAVEAGWTVTEVGRQPWIMYGIMKTKDAVSPMPGLQYSFYVITAVYLLLSVILFWLMRRQIRSLPHFYPSAKTS